MTDALQKALIIQKSWQDRWPHYCRSCEGWGVLQWEERHDRGYPGEPMSEPCSCIDGGKCPRCGAESISGDDKFFCAECGWNSEHPDVMPQLPEEDPQIDLEY